jgi:hypothetical protein
MEVNPYEQALANSPEIAIDSDFDQALQDERETNRVAANVSISQGLQKDPGLQAEVVSLSNRHNLPAEFVERNIDSFRTKQKASEYDFDAIAETNPGLTEWLKEPSHVAISKDDLSSLKEIESGVRLISSNKVKPFQFTGELTDAAQTGYQNLVSSGWHLALAYGKADMDSAAEGIANANKRAKELRDSMPEYAKEYQAIMEQQGGDVNAAASKFMSGVDDLREGRILKALKMISTGGLETAGEALDMLASAVVRPKGLIYSSTESLANTFPSILTGIAGAKAGAVAGAGVGSLVPGAGTAAGAAAGGTVGFGAGVFAGSAGVEVGSWMSSELERRGFDLTNPEEVKRAYSDPNLVQSLLAEAERKGVTTAGVDAVFSLIAGKYLKGATGSTVANKFKAAAKDVGIQMAGETASEASGQFAAKGEVDLGESLQEGFSSFGTSVVETGAGATVKAGSSLRDLFSKDPIKAAEEIVSEAHIATQSEQELTALQNIGAAVKNLKHTAKAEGALKKLIDLAGQGDEEGKVFFQPNDWDNYWNSKGESPIVKAAELGPEAVKAYQQAKETGSDFEISTGDYIEKIAPTEHFDGLMEKVKTTSDGKNLAEIKQMNEQLTTALEQVAKEADEMIKNRPGQVKTLVKEQLKQAGFKDADAAAQAAVYDAFSNQMAKITGQSPLEFYSSMNLNINRVEEGTIGALDEKSFNQLESLLTKGEETIQSYFKMPEQIEVAKVKQLPKAPSVDSPSSIKTLMNKRLESLVSQGDIENTHTGRKIKVTQRAINDSVDQALGFYDKMVKSGMKDKDAKKIFDLYMAGINSMESLVKNAVYFAQDKNNQHIFFSAFKSGKIDGVVKFRIGTKEGINEIYGFELVTSKATGTVSNVADPQLAEAPGDAPAPALISLSELTARVNKARKEQTYFQEANQVPPTYSKLEKLVAQKVGSSATPEQIMGILKEVKSEELEWFGIKEFLEGKEKVSKEDLLTHIRANMLEIKDVTKGAGRTSDLKVEKTFGGMFEVIDTSTNERIYHSIETREEAEQMISDYAKDTRYDEYTLPGGENYREILFTMPAKDGKDGYTSSHFKEQNILAHTRLKDRVDADGKKVLFIEEIQSDWHQEGRKRGYKKKVSPNQKAILEKKLDEARKTVGKLLGKVDDLGFDTTGQAMAAVYNDPDYAKNFDIENESELIKAIEDWKKQNKEVNQLGVPDAPLKKNWHEYVLKRVLRMAAEQGYDKVAWTTGEQQAERFDLSKKISEIAYLKRDDGTFWIKVDDMSGGSIYNERNVKADELSDLIGKEMADKIINDQGAITQGTRFKSISGDGLKVGGEGMKGFYDNILVKFANSFGKKFGTSVGQTEILSSSDSSERYVVMQSDETEMWYVLDQEKDGVVGDGYSTELAADRAMAKLLVSEKVKVHSMDITPELKSVSLSEGFTLFQGEEDQKGNLGQIRIGDKAINIDLFKGSNPSTFLHETGHLWLEMMGRVYDQVSNSPTKTQEQIQFIQDMETTLKYLKVKSFSEIGVEQHELWARSVETYFGEGVAPSDELRSAFARFRVWIISVYRNLMNLNAPLTDEVREVMNRLLAAQEAVEAAEGTRLFDDARSVGLSEEKAARYEKVRTDVRMQAEEKLTKKLMDDLKRKEKSQYKTEKSRLKEEAITNLSSEKIYKSIDFILNGKMPDGSDVKIHPDGVSKELIKRLPKKYLSKTGQNVEVIASLLGYRNGNELATLLADTPDIDKAAEQIASDEMSKRYPDSLNEDELKQYAEELVRSDKKSQLLRTELEMIVNGDFTIFKDVLKASVRRLPSTKDIKSKAMRMIDNRKISEIKPYIFRNGEKRAAKEAATSLAKGDINATFEAKKKELLSYEMGRAAEEATQNLEKFYAKFDKINRKDEKLSKTRDINFIYAARAIMSKYELSDIDPEKTSPLEQLKAYDPMAWESVMAVAGSVDIPAKPYDQLTYAEMKQVYEVVNSLWDLSKSSKEIEIDGKKIAKEEAKNELIFFIKQNTKKEFKAGYDKAVKNWDRVKVGLLGFKSSLRRVESWASAMDGDEFGPFRKYIWNPISEASDLFRADKAKYMDKFRRLTETISKSIPPEPIVASELGYEFKDKGELLGALLHTGNESNLKKLLLGRGWGEVMEDGSLNSQKWDRFMARMYSEGIITKVEMDYVQGVWDLMEELKPGAQKAFKKLYGHYFDEVTAKEIVTPFGQYRGGYAPAITDSFMVEDQSIREERSSFEQQSNSFMFPATGKGFTYSRVEGYTKPLVMDLRLFPQHLDKVLRFTHIQPKISEVSSLVMDKSFREALYGFDPTVGSELLVPWLQRAAQQKIETPAQGRGWKLVSRFAKALRSNAGLNAMAGNMTNALQQITGFSMAAVKVKPRFIRDAVWEYSRNSKEISKAISEKSSFMAERSGTQLFDAKNRVDEIILNPSKYEKFTDWAKEHGYFLQKSFQGFIDQVVWKAAYDESAEMGMTEEESVRRANSIVRETQGSFNPEDLSEFETGTAFRRLFTMFYSYFNMQANLLGTEFSKTYNELGVKKGAGRMLYIYAMGMMIPAVTSELIVKAMSGKFDEDDDDEYMDDFMVAFFNSQFRTTTAMIPFAGPTINATVNTFNGKPYDDRISTSPAVVMLESAVRAPKSVYEAVANDGDGKRAVRDFLSLMGLVSGVPVLPASKPIVYLNDVNSGEAEPEGSIDFARGLMTGKSGQ